MDETRLRRELREAALAHHPDRARMLARVARGRAGPPGRARRPAAPARVRRRPAGLAVAATVAAVAALGVFGAFAVPALPVLRDRPAPPPAATAPAPGPAARATGTLGAASNRWWAQNDLAVTLDGGAAGAVVEIRVARAPGTAATGRWHTRPAEDFTTAVTEEPDALVYRWTLAPGRTLPPGTHTFAAQYAHAEGARTPAADTYTVALTAPGGGRTTLRGGFTGPP
ncbi:hypothetical protein ACWD4X_22255 [Streptomyces termitum]